MSDTPEPVTESFSWSKWFSGFFNGVSNAKDLKTIVFIGFLILFGFMVWKTFFVKTQQQTQQNHTTVTAQSGSHVVVEAPKQEMKTEKSHWSVGPFIGGSTGDGGSIFAGAVLLYNF